MKNESAIDFAFRRFGEKVAPDSKTAWLSCCGRLLKNSDKKNAGEKSNGMGGTSVYISDSNVVIFGPDYPEFGFAAAGDPGDAEPFAFKKALEAPKERWLMVIFAKAGVRGENLHLNHPGDKESVYFSKNKLIRIRFDAVNKLANVFLQEGLSSGSAEKIIHRYREFLAGEAADKSLEKILTMHPRIMHPIASFIESGIPPRVVAKAMEIYQQEVKNV